MSTTTKIIVSRKTLSSALERISALPYVRTGASFTSAVRITWEAGTVTLACNDYGTYAEARFEAQVLGSGRLLVDRAQLVNLVKSVKVTNKPSTPVDVVITFTDKTLTLTFEGDRSHTATLPLIEPDEFPSRPDGETVHLFAAPAPEVLDLWKRVGIAAGKDDTLPMLESIFFDSTDGYWTFAATDRYRLAVAESSFKADTTQELMVPAAVIKKLVAKTFAKCESKLDVWRGQDDLTIGFSGFVDGMFVLVTTRLLEGQYVGWRQLCKTEGDEWFALFDSDQATAAIKNAALTLEKNTAVKLVLEPGMVSIVGGIGREGDGESSQRFPVIGGCPNGETFEAGFNPIYFTDGIAAVTTDGTCTFTATQPRKPAWLTSVGSRVKYLLMPVQLPGKPVSE